MVKKDAAALIARILIGGIFIAAGWMKVAAMGMTVGYFSQMGLPAALAYIVSYAELLGGIAIVLGLWVELAAAGLAIIMIGATYFSYQAAPSMNVSAFQAVMPTLGILGALLSLIASGAGKFVVPLKRRPVPTV